MNLVRIMIAAWVVVSVGAGWTAGVLTHKTPQSPSSGWKFELNIKRWFPQPPFHPCCGNMEIHPEELPLPKIGMPKELRKHNHWSEETARQLLLKFA